jgi:hypothetical protein
MQEWPGLTEIRSAILHHIDLHLIAGEKRGFCASARLAAP